MRKVLIANRGEIACRLVLACQERGLEAVGVFAPSDAQAPHVSLADEAYALAGDEASTSYLSAASLIEIAKRCGADAIHPGYGFLSETPEFALAVESNGLTWVGPPATAIAQMGHKLKAREAAKAADVPVLPGGLLDMSALGNTSQLSFPLMVKATGGGGGLGLRRVDTPDDLERAMLEAKAQCAAAFAGEELPGPQAVELYWEAFLPHARHIEVQIVADHHGDVRHFGARECSVQRRFQKLIEECPPAALDAAQIDLIGAMAVRVARAVGYANVGTVEFLWTPATGPVFLEMNTRLQVEHPVTELVYGIDLVQFQLALAARAHLKDLIDVAFARGHAIEARIYAEDPNTGAPAAGRIDHLRWPTGPGIRVDAGVQVGQNLSTQWDALLGKIIAYGSSRESARRRLALALARTEIVGTLATNIVQLRAILEAEAFRAGTFDTALLGQEALALPLADARVACQIAAIAEATPATTTPETSGARGRAPWHRQPWRGAH